jgi:hypothetical protein
MIPKKKKIAIDILLFLEIEILLRCSTPGAY